MKKKGSYTAPEAAYSGYAEDVVMASIVDNITQDKEWSEWTDEGGTL